MEVKQLELTLLRIIENNPHIHLDMLTKITNEPKEVIQQALDALIANKILFQQNFVINWAAISNEKRILARIDLKTIPKATFGFDELAEEISHFEQVQSVYLISGVYDLSVMVQTSSMDDISHLVSRFASLASVQETATNFIMKRYKHEQTLFIDEENDSRMKVSL
ncbi:Lrp/AsnC family transcriptional regulator [Enterococcus saccharolyticus]|uniref:Transcription regulator AsnC/Lrp ligand binding domain-containing protein n=1 Tax=Enterococcus saccharolyticus subsp. saccharolyticus ATCC 43076 TaxID=1139996 RepID=S0JNG0_9ENTE|nr:Lrp/AsnC ligand binding domain-containing protein [Enterococcus saccharolyticus]EOT29378.1 hypothetical protein OMQ_01330 [Enterococcus saccharolyticus subsp. saccharolyticus ATCC 43076]EOT81176.1 hypothetical protein I572_01708 [Enterococcus saccharolyticus subsp. saccharolyticus ATCC 43076]OJG88497.1 hypothetical protein RV16_GL000239 [Enterococcus saccharolyticus]